MRLPLTATALSTLWLLGLGFGLGTTACARSVETTRVAGSDDAAIDAAAAKLEELRARQATDDLACEDQCALGSRTCSVAEELCALVDRNPDRDDLPTRCAQAREQCAGAQDGCTRCHG